MCGTPSLLPTSCAGGAGIYVDDILEAVPIDKYFELFKPKNGGDGGFIRVAMNFSTESPEEAADSALRHAPASLPCSPHLADRVRTNSATNQATDRTRCTARGSANTSCIYSGLTWQLYAIAVVHKDSPIRAHAAFLFLMQRHGEKHHIQPADD